MRVYLMRHGIALDVGAHGMVCDADRPLSREGLQKTVEIAEGLRALGVAPARILASPLVRAAQTAEQVAQALHPRDGVEAAPDFAPGGDPGAQVRALNGEGDALAVGHMPDLSDTLAALLTGAPRGLYDFRKGGVACVGFEGAARLGRGWLEWFLTSGQLRRLRRTDGA